MSTTRWIPIAGLLGCLLFVGPVAAEDAARADDRMTDEWWAQAATGVEQMEYRITRQERSVIPGHPGGLHATNRAQNLRVYFLPDGVDIVPRDATEPSWTLRLALRDVVPSARSGVIRDVEPSAVDRTVTYRRGSVTERWENTPRGMVIGLSLPADPAGVSPIEAVFDLATDLEAIASADGSEVSLYRDGARVARLTVGGMDARLALEGDLLRVGIPAGAAAASAPVQFEIVLGGGSPGVQVGLSVTPDWTAESDEINAWFGSSVATAGDVNGDGYSDVIVGAPHFDAGHGLEGRAFLYLGSAAGLSTQAAWTDVGSQIFAFFGSSVATAGDVNRDGYSDVIVGSPALGLGAAFVYYGSKNVRENGLELKHTLHAGEETGGTRFGFSVSTAGDVNGDGYSDVIVGAPCFDRWDPGHGCNTSIPRTYRSRGRVFVFHGGLDGLSDSAAWSRSRVQDYEEFGHSVSTAGDVDGDGYSDVIIGGPRYTTDPNTVVLGEENGRATLYLGSADGLGLFPKSVIVQDEIWFGASVATAGDVNGDGLSDVIVGAPGTQGIWLNPAAFVFYGSQTPNELEDAEGLRLPGSQDGSEFGSTVATAGDVNGDGYADVIVGASDFSPQDGPPGAGQVFLYLGSAEGPSLAEWPAVGGQQQADYGHSVATAGDVNGDGFSDVIVGARFLDNGESSEGRAFVYHGSASVPSASEDWRGEAGESVAAGDVNGDGYSDVIVGAFLYLGGSAEKSPVNWPIDGEAGAEDFENSPVSAAGDVNGDGYSDLIVGPPEDAVLRLGSAAGISTPIDWNPPSDEDSEEFGSWAATAGDVDGDGCSDVIVGAPYFDRDGEETYEGRASVYLGSGPDSAEGEGLSNSPAWTVEGQGDEWLGTSVAAAGDVNGDGYGDVIVGAPYFEDVPGCWDDYGTIASCACSDSVCRDVICGEYADCCDDWDSSCNEAASVEPACAAGCGVGGPGDCCTDDEEEPTYEGRAAVYLGSASGLSTTAAWNVEGKGYDTLGTSVATAGDVNGDGYSDVIVGAPGFDNAEIEMGRAHVYHGSASGLSASAAWTVEGEEAYEEFGSVVATAGDVNGDGYSDVIVGTPEFGSFGVFGGRGRALLYLGSASGLSTSVDWIATTPDDETFSLGSRVGTAGDVNGDGYSDMIVDGAVRFPDFLGAGPVTFLHLGNASDGRPLRMRQVRVASEDPIGLHGKSDSEVGFRIKADSRRSPGGGGKVGLEWEAAALGSEWVGPPPPHDLVTPPEPDLVTQVGSLTPGTFYWWRARVVTDSPFFPRSPWSSVPGNNYTESSLRTAGSLPSASFGLHGPSPNEPVFADSVPTIFTWHTGRATESRVEWSRNPQFVPPLVTLPVDADHEEWGICRPDDELWDRILQLGQQVDFQPAPIFWRVVPTAGASPGADAEPFRVLRLATARGPDVTRPGDGAALLETVTPLFTWDPNHNNRFQVRFSANSHIGQPRIVFGQAYDLDVVPFGPTGVEVEWSVTDEQWNDIVDFAGSNPEGRVYYAVFAKDALDRTSWSEVRSLRLSGVGTQVETGRREPPSSAYKKKSRHRPSRRR